MNAIYNVKTKWLEGRKGEISSDVLPDSILVATPPEFAKGIPGIWSPEHLLIGAISSCFMTTFLAIAEKTKLEFGDFTCSASGVLSEKDGKLQLTKIALHPSITVFTASCIEKGMKVLQYANSACLISHSVNSEIVMASQVSLSKKPTDATPTL